VGAVGVHVLADAVDRPGRVLTIEMKYSPERARVISGVKRISKPGLRVYTKAEKIPRVLGGSMSLSCPPPRGLARP
jgi:small subunit ribosomal protein S8